MQHTNTMMQLLEKKLGKKFDPRGGEEMVTVELVTIAELMHEYHTIMSKKEVVERFSCSDEHRKELEKALSVYMM